MTKKKEHDTLCQYEYLPDEDGVVYTCGDDDDVEEYKETGLYLCQRHRSFYGEDAAP